MMQVRARRLPPRLRPGARGSRWTGMRRRILCRSLERALPALVWRRQGMGLHLSVALNAVVRRTSLMVRVPRHDTHVHRAVRGSQGKPPQPARLLHRRHSLQADRRVLQSAAPPRAVRDRITRTLRAHIRSTQRIETHQASLRLARQPGATPAPNPARPALLPITRHAQPGRASILPRSDRAAPLPVSHRNTHRIDRIAVPRRLGILQRRHSTETRNIGRDGPAQPPTRHGAQRPAVTETLFALRLTRQAGEVLRIADATVPARSGSRPLARATPGTARIADPTPARLASTPPGAPPLPVARHPTAAPSAKVTERLTRDVSETVTRAVTETMTRRLTEETRRAVQTQVPAPTDMLNRLDRGLHDRLILERERRG